jgi:2-aminoadipate transaminase
VDSRIQDLQRRAAGDPRVVGLAGGLPADVQFPKRALAHSFLRVLRRTGAPALQYGWAEGSEGLRAFIAGRLRARGASTDAADVIVTSGAQQAIAIALELLCRAGDRVGVGAETYPGALELMRARGLRPVPSWADVRVCYVMPAVDNPRGAALSAEARRAALATGASIIEDDAFGDLRFDGPAPRPLLADAPDRVLHVGTLSKTLCPGLRIGWLVAPPGMRRHAVCLKQGGDLQASSLAQAVIEDYLTGGGAYPPEDFEGRLARLRRFYRIRAGALHRALRAFLPGWRLAKPVGGFAIWAEAPIDAPPVDEVAFLEAAVAAGVTFDPGSMFRPDGAGAPLALRLCFSSAPVASFVEGARRLARAWHLTAPGVLTTP